MIIKIYIDKSRVYKLWYGLEVERDLNEFMKNQRQLKKREFFRKMHYLDLPSLLFNIFYFALVISVLTSIGLLLKNHNKIEECLTIDETTNKPSCNSIIQSDLVMDWNLHTRIITFCLYLMIIFNISDMLNHLSKITYFQTVTAFFSNLNKLLKRYILPLLFILLMINFAYFGLICMKKPLVAKPWD